MGREVRRVPKDWEHPKDKRGKYIPLFENTGSFLKDDEEWMEGWQKWQEGLRRSYEEGDKWVPIEKECQHMLYSEYEVTRPSPDDYMPYWPEEERTHFMMYENVSEGTPISPAFETLEALAKWLAEENAPACGSTTATYEQWLAVCKAGWAPSLVWSAERGVQSGVQAMSDLDASRKNPPGGKK